MNVNVVIGAFEHGLTFWALGLLLGLLSGFELNFGLIAQFWLSALKKIRQRLKKLKITNFKTSEPKP